MSFDNYDKDIVANSKFEPFTQTRLYFECAIIMSDNQKFYLRVIYSLLDVLGDFGGLNEVVIGILALLLGPWVEY